MFKRFFPPSSACRRYRSTEIKKKPQAVGNRSSGRFLWAAGWIASKNAITNVTFFVCPQELPAMGTEKVSLRY
ncbi:MAG: hypothetical protein ACFFAE_18975 [Candidatus Hodarchaeota archaeon]